MTLSPPGALFLYLVPLPNSVPSPIPRGVMTKTPSQKGKKLKVSSCTPRSEAPSAVVDAQQVRRKARVLTFTPETRPERGPIQNSAAGARTLQTTKLKATGGGFFRVSSSRGHSGVTVPHVQINDPRTTEDILEEWFSSALNLGWDEGYVNSFVDRNLIPPTCDPDTPPQTTQTSRKGVSTVHASSRVYY